MSETNTPEIAGKHARTRPPPLLVAPMMDWTDRHCRYFHRLLSPHALLYTEMVTAPAVLHGKRGACCLSGDLVRFAKLSGNPVHGLIGIAPAK